MKAIKKNFENLQAVARRITSVDFSTGRFYVDNECSVAGYVRLFSYRNSIGDSILRMIPCNYRYRVSFEDDKLKLRIWCI